MTIIFEERASDSAYVETVITGYTAACGSSIRPAESRWHMVFSKREGRLYPLIVGALQSSGTISYGAGAELLWIRFRLGTYMPGIPARLSLDVETPLPNGASANRFWLGDRVWQCPNDENADTFVDQLIRAGVLAFDPVVDAALRRVPQPAAARTIRHRFLHTTGMTQKRIRQIERAQQAAALLRQGTSILDTVEIAGYFDQPHLTRALRQWVGHTPAEIVRSAVIARESDQRTDRSSGDAALLVAG